MFLLIVHLHFYTFCCFEHGHGQRTKEMEFSNKIKNKETGEFHNQAHYIPYTSVWRRLATVGGCSTALTTSA